MVPGQASILELFPTTMPIRSSPPITQGSSHLTTSSPIGCTARLATNPYSSCAVEPYSYHCPDTADAVVSAVARRRAHRAYVASLARGISGRTIASPRSLVSRRCSLATSTASLASWLTGTLLSPPQVARRRGEVALIRLWSSNRCLAMRVGP